MKGLILASLALNLGLAGYFLYSRGTPDQSATGLSGGAKGSASVQRIIQRKGATHVILTNLPSDFSWRTIESADFKQYIQNLRQLECPEALIRDIIAADINKMYAPKIAALNRTDLSQNFWEFHQYRPPSKEKQKQLREIEKEKEELLKELLGPNAKKEMEKISGGFNHWEETLGALPEEKRDKLREVQRQFSEEEQEVYGRLNCCDEDDMADLKKIRKKKDAEMAKFLTAQELEDYQLKTSETANQLRNDFKYLQPTEQEFREVFRVQKALDDTDKGRKEGEQQFKAILGEERFAEYQRSRDYAYRSLQEILTYQGVDRSAAAKVYDMKKVTEEQVRKIQADKTLTPEQRKQTLAEIRAVTEKEILDSIGEKALKNYKRQGGYWIRNISN